MISVKRFLKISGNENTQIYQVQVVVFLQHQILVIDLQGNVKQLEGRINQINQN